MPRYFTLAAPPRGVPGAPSDASTAAGLLPVMAGASPKALKWGLWGNSEQLCGQPGTQAIRVKGPALDRGHTSKALVGWTGSSSDTPDVIYPSLYYVHGIQEHAPVSLHRTNNMPVPAVDAYNPAIKPTQERGGSQQSRIAQIAARSWHVGGRKATAWPAAPQRWRTR
jgi:hypothetical protein